MTYATKQLTQALQELTTSRSRQGGAAAGQSGPQRISAQQLHFSKEVEAYLEQKQTYTQRTRSVSEGSY